MKRIVSTFKKIGKGLLIPIFVLLLIFSSCQDKIELQPNNSMSETVAFSTPAYIELAVTGVYNAAQLGYYNNAPRGYPFGAAFVEQGDCRGEDVVNQAAFYQFTYQATYTTTTLNNTWMWSDTYRMLNRCNIVIEGVRQAGLDEVISPEKALEYEAEARLLRAFGYHELMIHFARPYGHSAGATHPGVPFYEKPFTTLAAIAEGLAQGRNTCADVYSKIIEDLNFAEANLPSKAIRTGNTKVTRGTKGAAVALKTRVYLHMWDMTNVITEATKFLAGGSLATQYAIAASPGLPFSAPYTNSESIFGMENTAASNPGVNAALGSQYKTRQLVCISPMIWRDATWLVDDKRRIEGDLVFTSLTGVKHTNKYKDGTTYSDPSPMIRYAEVMLNLAEAYARNNDVVNGLTYLNIVRNRSLADVPTQAYIAANFADNVALLGAILKERRIEFIMEGRRWSDITRLQQCPHFPIDGIPAKVANGAQNAAAFVLGTPYVLDPITRETAKPYTDHRFLWPFPQAEVDANPVLLEQQNPGW